MLALDWRQCPQCGIANPNLPPGVFPIKIQIQESTIIRALQMLGLIVVGVPVAAFIMMMVAANHGRSDERIWALAAIAFIVLLRLAVVRRKT